LHGRVGSLGGLCQLASVRDRAAPAPQEHGPPASGAAWLALDCRPAHLGAGFANGLHGSHGDRPHPLAAK